MAWNVNATVDTVEGNVVTATGIATGTDDDTTIENVVLTIVYSAVPDHVKVGNVIAVEANC